MYTIVIEKTRQYTDVVVKCSECNDVVARGPEMEYDWLTRMLYAHANACHTEESHG